MIDDPRPNCCWSIWVCFCHAILTGLVIFCLYRLCNRILLFMALMRMGHVTCVGIYKWCCWWEYDFGSVELRRQRSYHPSSRVNIPPISYTMATFLVMLFFHHWLLRIFNDILAPPHQGEKKSKLLGKVVAKIVENQLKKYLKPKFFTHRVNQLE